MIASNSILLANCINPCFFFLPVVGCLFLNILLNLLFQIILNPPKLLLFIKYIRLQVSLLYFFHTFIPCWLFITLLWSLKNFRKLFQRRFILVWNYQIRMFPYLEIEHFLCLMRLERLFLIHLETRQNGIIVT